jgi:hypothetical protein
MGMFVGGKPNNDSYQATEASKSRTGTTARTCVTDMCTSAPIYRYPLECEDSSPLYLGGGGCGFHRYCQ